MAKHTIPQVQCGYWRSLSGHEWAAKELDALYSPEMLAYYHEMSDYPNVQDILYN